MKTNCLVFAILFFLLSPSFGLGQTVVPGFTIPDTVCVNAPVTITNTSVSASSYYWNFCTANINATPGGINFGNPGGQLTTPCFIDYAYENGNWYGFITSNNPPSLVRLEFGNSLLNTPTAVNLGNFGGMLPYGAQGIQLVQEGGNWYAFITGGDSVAVPGQTSRIDFGNSLLNAPTSSVNLGNFGDRLNSPRDLYIFNYCNESVGFLINDNTGDLHFTRDL